MWILIEFVKIVETFTSAIYPRTGALAACLPFQICLQCSTHCLCGHIVHVLCPAAYAVAAIMVHTRALAITI